MKNKTVVFIGHNDCTGLETGKLKSEIIKSIENGAINFISGGMGEYDRICARLVYEIKIEYPNIKNLLVIPYLNFNIFEKRYFDEIIFPEELEYVPKKASIIKRNQYMVDKSSYAICYVNYSYGGAAKTFQYANKKNVEIINLGKLNIK
ncbi:MAG: DUF1273 family protein [Ruminococcus sp.]|nr:DUF1273 family protein [Ruminococcus sp.]